MVGFWFGVFLTSFGIAGYVEDVGVDGPLDPAFFSMVMGSAIIATGLTLCASALGVFV